MSVREIISHDEETCRICLKGGNLEKIGCSCHGSIGFTHKKCLVTWIQYSRRYQCFAYNSTGTRCQKWQVCEVCCTKYPDKVLGWVNKSARRNSWSEWFKSIFKCTR